MALLMKGKVWGEHKHKLVYPVMVEVKYDEIRVRVQVHPGGAVSFDSYAEKPLANMQGFAEFFTNLAHETGWKVFDCGFEVNGNFNDSYRWVRSTRGIPDDLKDAHPLFYLFDLPEHEGTYWDRLADMAEVIEHGVLGVEGKVAHSEAEVEEFYEKQIALGREGAMVKTLTHFYQRGKRTDQWLKLKPEEEADGVIEGIIEATATVADPAAGISVGDPLGRAGSVQVRVEDGSSAKPGGIGHALGREMFEHPERFIGQWCEFKYMQRDRAGGYRHPRFHRLREEKV